MDKEKFMTRVSVAESGCWIWTGCVQVNGYGIFKVGGRKGRWARRSTTATRRRCADDPRDRSVAARRGVRNLARATDEEAMNALAKSVTGDSWCTPKWLADLVGWFDLDPCSNERSHIRSGYRCALDSEPSLGDGLEIEWKRDWSVWTNPPFSDVGPWAAKLAAHNGPWCALVKLDPSTRWFATLMSANPTVAPFKKRIKFEGDRAMTANFPCALVWKRWEPSDELAQHLWMRRWG